MKKKFKKGFTLVELVIVIAVIAVLAAVLIPTFAGVVSKSKQSAALQEATTAVTVMVTSTDGEPITGAIIKTSNDRWFTVGVGGQLTASKSALTVSGTFLIESTTVFASGSTGTVGEKIAPDLSAGIKVYLPATFTTAIVGGLTAVTA